MEGPIEKLITRKHDIVDNLSIVIVIFGATVVLLATIVLNFLSDYIAIIFGVVLFLCTKFVISKNIEFEYSYFEGDLEIDKIINKKKRKRIANVSVKDFEVFGAIKAFQQVRQKPEETFYCNSSPDAEESSFFITNYNAKRTAFFFEPNEPMIAEIIRRIPSKILKGE